MTNLPAAHVLLVEDDASLPEVLADLLHDSNITLTHAANGKDALRRIHDSHVDLVLLDLGLPDINGFDLLEQLKAEPETQPIPVIILTAFNSPEDKVRGFQIGATDYLTKPFEASELRARLCAVLRAKRLADALTKANRELAEARDAAEATARKKAEFLANMSHEIRTPMNGVVSMAGLLRETNLTPEQRSFVDTIYSSSESLITIINDILDFSKIESGKLEFENRPLDLRNTVEEALDMLAARASEKKLDLAYQFDDNVPTSVLGDVTRLRQILVNLIGNSVKFTEQGEVVTIVKITAAPSSPEESWQFEFTVRDTGIGISPSLLPRLFKPFVQAEASTTRQFGGTGLGLCISNRLVELMGGKMWAESTPGMGSTFHFTLPLHAAPQSAQPRVDSAQPKLSGLKLLIVDDNPTNCRILSLQTAKWGMTTRSAYSGLQALEWLRAEETFDLAILDMQMPGMDGLMLASEIRKISKAQRMPLVLLTSMGIRGDSPDFVQASFAACLTKPIKPVQLQESLLRIVSGTRSAPVPVPTNKLDPSLAARLPLRVLLCDDNVINQKVGSRVLQQMGYRATVAGNGVEALAAIEKQQYDLVFMDVMMPEMDGLEATRQIRARKQDPAAHANFKSPIIIVAMTASAMTGDKEKCLESGMDDYLAKPVRPEEVRAVIERWGPNILVKNNTDNPLKPEVTGKIAVIPAPASDVPPIDLERLNEFSEGDPQNLRELVDLYIKQTTGQMEELAAAVRDNRATDVRRVAHSCAGASATCGMRRIVPPLRELERQGDEGKLENANELCEQVKTEFEAIKAALAPFQSAGNALAPKT
ncbi:MAG: response regulator [Verrucomicrobia bacterium]|nr:response regulator [Verrucomicrobiota bacterium]